MARRERWVNWDQLAVGEDFWDMMDDINAKRMGEIREQRQMDEINRLHARQLEKMKIDRAKFMEGEPYSFMCKVPIG